MAMLNLFGRKNRIKKQKRKIVRTVQQSIPIDAIYKDGIFRTGRLFSKSWKFSDINYAVASDDDQLQIFLVHSAILNGLPTDAMAEIVMYLYLYRYIGIFLLYAVCAFCCSLFFRTQNTERKDDL